MALEVGYWPLNYALEVVPNSESNGVGNVATTQSSAGGEGLYSDRVVTIEFQGQQFIVLGDWPKG